MKKGSKSQRITVSEAFGLALARARTSREISQESLALATGFARTYPGMLERGERQPTMTTLLLMASALSIEPEELVHQTRQILAAHHVTVGPISPIKPPASKEPEVLGRAKRRGRPIKAAP